MKLDTFKGKTLQASHGLQAIITSESARAVDLVQRLLWRMESPSWATPHPAPLLSPALMDCLLGC